MSAPPHQNADGVTCRGGHRTARQDAIPQKAHTRICILSPQDSPSF